MVHARAAMQLFSLSVDVATQELSSKFYPWAVMLQKFWTVVVPSKQNTDMPCKHYSLADKSIMFSRNIHMLSALNLRAENISGFC